MPDRMGDELIVSYQQSGVSSRDSGGIIPIGQRQVVNKNLVTSPADRPAIAKILKILNGSPAARSVLKNAGSGWGNTPMLAKSLSNNEVIN